LLDLVDDATMIFVRTLAEDGGNRIRCAAGPTAQWAQLAEVVQ
jgi:hypothetical protein